MLMISTNLKLEFEKDVKEYILSLIEEDSIEKQLEDIFKIKEDKKENNLNDILKKYQKLGLKELSKMHKDRGACKRISNNTFRTLFNSIIKEAQY